MDITEIEEQIKCDFCGKPNVKKTCDRCGFKNVKPMSIEEQEWLLKENSRLQKFYSDVLKLLVDYKNESEH